MTDLHRAYNEIIKNPSVLRDVKAALKKVKPKKTPFDRKNSWIFTKGKGWL